MALQDPNSTLTLLYGVRNDLLTGKLQSYSIGDRTITLVNLDSLEKIITKYEGIVAAATPIYADLSGIAHQSPWGEG
jgi:hypothetical protein